MFLPPLFYLSFYQWSETFAKEPDKVRFFQSSLFIKFLENRLEVFEVRSSVLQFFLLKLRVTFEFALGCINESLRITNILSKKSFEIGLRVKILLVPDICTDISGNWSTHKQKKWQMRYNLTYWVRRYRNGLCIIGKNGSILYMVFRNRDLEIVPLASLFVALFDNFPEGTSLYRVL